MYISPFTQEQRHLNYLWGTQVYQFPGSEHASRAKGFLSRLSAEQFVALIANTAKPYKDEFLLNGGVHSNNPCWLLTGENISNRFDK